MTHPTLIGLVGCKPPFTNVPTFLDSAQTSSNITLILTPMLRLAPVLLQKLPMEGVGLSLNQLFRKPNLTSIVLKHGEPHWKIMVVRVLPEVIGRELHSEMRQWLVQISQVQFSLFSPSSYWKVPDGISQTTTTHSLSSGVKERVVQSNKELVHLEPLSFVVLIPKIFALLITWVPLIVPMMIPWLEDVIIGKSMETWTVVSMQEMLITLPSIQEVS